MSGLRFKTPVRQEYTDKTTHKINFIPDKIFFISPVSHKKQKNLHYLFYDCSLYHVCTNGLEQITLLKDEEDYKTAWNYLALSAWRTEVQIVVFTIMSNHIHEIIACYFSSSRNDNAIYAASLTFSQKRKMLKTGLDLSGCPFQISEDGLITLDSFIRYDIVERAYRHSGKSFLYYLGCCNDAKMEYELTCQPLMRINDNDMQETVTKYVAHRFRDKSISELTSAEKCTILKPLFFNNKTSIPQQTHTVGVFAAHYEPSPTVCGAPRHITSHGGTGKSPLCDYQNGKKSGRTKTITTPIRIWRGRPTLT